MKHLNVLHQSDNFIVVNKDYDIIINTDDTNRISLQQQLTLAFPHLINKQLHYGFYFPHRLDFSTSGVMCIALSKKSCAAASTAFRERHTQKYYLALLRGHVSDNQIDVNVPIGEGVEIKGGPKVMSSKGIHTKPALSRLLVLERGTYASLPATKVLLRPLTGRRHQLRVHCRSIGHIIVGDYTYSERRDVAPPRMFLHAFRLIMPNNVEVIDISTEDPFTQDLYPDWKPEEEVQKLNENAIRLLVDQLEPKPR